MLHNSVRSLRYAASEARLYTSNHIVAHIPFHYVREAYLRKVMRISIGRCTSVHMGVILYCVGSIDIGHNTVIDRECTLDGRGSIRIGSNVNLSPRVVILTASHDPDDRQSFRGVVASVVIEDYVWIATSALVLPGVTIGRGAVVGAGSIVTNDVRPNWIVAGNPARPIRERIGPQEYTLRYRRLFQ